MQSNLLTIFHILLFSPSLVLKSKDLQQGTKAHVHSCEDPEGEAKAQKHAFNSVNLGMAWSPTPPELSRWKFYGIKAAAHRTFPDKQSAGHKILAGIHLLSLRTEGFLKFIGGGQLHFLLLLLFLPRLASTPTSSMECVNNLLCGDERLFESSQHKHISIFSKVFVHQQQNCGFYTVA